MDATQGSRTPFRFDSLAGFPLIHGVTTRDLELPGEGDMNIAGRLPITEALTNRHTWSSAIGVNADALVCGRQVHGINVRVVDERHRGLGARDIEEALPQTDALITQSSNLPLMVYTADCVPVIAYDPVRHALGLAHAGWRGTVGNIAGQLVAAMAAEFGSDPVDLIVKLGPSIGPCCYEVGDEVISAWSKSGLDPHSDAIRSADPRSHLDLWRANSLALEASGVPSAHIEHSGLCTRCHADRFFSRRAGQGHRGLFATIGQLK
ncbi:MAG TPA: peptidoglycan editing factor PgeF [Nitrolancea sp.]|nr:peptidoglycan editing factor PgeF [Nitrolancea sp.]